MWYCNASLRAWMQATLMKRVQWYLVEGWTSVECRIGDKQPVYLCSLNQGSVSLEVEFEESEDIIFRARGYRGVRLSGYYVSQSTETYPLYSLLLF